MVTSTITIKGQVVIPAFIRKKLGLKKGVRLCISQRDDKIILQPLTADYFKKAAGFLSSKVKLTKKLLEERQKDRQKES